MEELMSEIEKYSETYQFSFQFWGHGNNNVFIMKGDVDLFDTGGLDAPIDALQAALTYIYKINRVPKQKRAFLTLFKTI